MEDELQLEHPPSAPNTQSYSIESNGDQTDSDTDTNIQSISLDDALEYLKQIQTAVLCNTHLFNLAEQLTQGVQTMKVQM